jgi:hypothetical protein
VPLPEDLPADGLAIFTFWLANKVVYPDLYISTLSPTTYLPKRNSVVIEYGELGPDGTIFTIVSGALAELNSCQIEDCSISILEPDGSYTGLDGITIKANEHLDKRFTVYIRRLSNVSELSPLSENPDSRLKAETAYYKIGVTGDYQLDPSGSFSVNILLPENVSTEGLAVFKWIEYESNDLLDPLPLPDGTMTASGYWISSRVNYHPDTNEVSFQINGLEHQRLTFIIVSGNE